MERALDGRPASRWPFFWRSHRAFLLLLAVAAPLTIAFSWQEVIATLGDDSVSYLTLSRSLTPFHSDPLTAPWAKYYSHFPPLFPLALALTGGSHDFLVAHLLVGACALLALPLIYGHASLHLGNRTAGVLVVVLFLLAPSAWVSIRGILSEPLYLTLSLAALAVHDRRLAVKPGTGPALAFGILLAAAFLTRLAGLALVVAYAMHVAVGAISRRERPPGSTLVAIVPIVVLASLWIALRPAPQAEGYGETWQFFLQQWWTKSGLLLSASIDFLLRGWLSSFTGESEVGLASRIAFAAVGALAIAGAALGAMRNRLDAWYVLASLAVLFLWVFPEENTRRLLYPLLPLMLIHAGEAIAAACSRLGAPRLANRALLVSWAFVVAMVLPASFLTLQKASDREPFAPGFAYSASSITNYYTTLNVTQARGQARTQATILSGLQSIDLVTPPGSRVMWMRPEYVALLGKRPAVPWYFGWDRRTLAREIRRSGTGYVVVARVFKTDLAGGYGDAFALMVLNPPSYLMPVLVLRGEDGRSETFILLKVDPAALDLYLAQSG
ncbi:MAG: hypothetical protein ACXWG1_19110 [Usitatibacter sp.]